KSDVPSFIKAAAGFTWKCLRYNATSGIDDLRVVLKDMGLVDWPYRKEPKNDVVVDVLMKMDKWLQVYPLMKLSIAKRFVNENYLIHVNPPDVIMSRFQIVYPSEGHEMYRERMRSLIVQFTTDDGTVAHITEDIAQLEARLQELSKPCMKSRWLPN